MALRMAVKRLSAVETDPERSHQHEFHAGRLRRELEFAEERTPGVLTCLLFGRDGEPPIVDQDRFTLYDAREGNESRPAEWHLYYASQVISEVARAGDLLILYRHETGLHALVAPAGSAVERDLLRALDLGDDAIRSQFSFLDVPAPEEHSAREVVGQLTLLESVAEAYQVSDHALFGRAVRDGRLPSTSDMAVAAADIARIRGIGRSDPDAYLMAALEAESDLYYSIELQVQTGRLDELLTSGPGLTDVIDFAMTVQQSRRSRRGQSLQNHFAAVLRAANIPFSAQCTTERGETPDFVVPGCTEYHDPDFDSGRLRMVACKSTAKERWRQVLNEAERIPDKYLVTLDRQLTTSTIAAMDRAGVRAFLPSRILDDDYATHPARGSLGSIADLLAQLREDH